MVYVSDVKLDLDELERVAKEALKRWPDDWVVSSPTSLEGGDKKQTTMMEFVAAFKPSTVLALIAELRELEREKWQLIDAGNVALALYGSAGLDGEHGVEALRQAIDEAMQKEELVAESATPPSKQTGRYDASD